MINLIDEISFVKLVKNTSNKDVSISMILLLRRVDLFQSILRNHIHSEKFKR